MSTEQFFSSGLTHSVSRRLTLTRRPLTTPRTTDAPTRRLTLTLSHTTPPTTPRSTEVPTHRLSSQALDPPRPSTARSSSAEMRPLVPAPGAAVRARVNFSSGRQRSHMLRIFGRDMAREEAERRRRICSFKELFQVV